MAYAFISGATSGLGLEYSKQLAGKGYNLIMVGRRKEILCEEALKIEKENKIKVKTIICELSNELELNDLIKLLNELDQKESIEFFINNAGFGMNKDFFEDEYFNQEKMIKVHINALTKLIHFIVPKMRERKKGNIINVSSLAAFIPLPRSPFYCSTKSFINTFTESIYPELKQNNINIQALCPGFIKTDFHSRQNLKKEKLKKNFFIEWMETEKVVKLSLKNIKKSIYIPGIKNKILFFFIKIIPKQIYYNIAGKLSREYKKMGD